MYINGYSRQKVMEQIKKRNLGFPAEYLGNCKYRADMNGETNCCLVGAFIPDDIYNESIEDQDASYVYEHLDVEGLMPLSQSMMLKLQEFHDDWNLHDTNDFHSDIEDYLIELEANFNG